MTTQTIDSQTLHMLQHQGQRMRVALHETTPPDRVEAARIQVLVDDILDRRPRPIAVASDGEILWEGTSPYVIAQGSALPGTLTTAVNATDKPEPVLTADQLVPKVAPIIDVEPDEFTEGPGGVAVLDREQIRDAEPGDGRERPPISQAEIDETRRLLGDGQ